MGQDRGVGKGERGLRAETAESTPESEVTVGPQQRRAETVLEVGAVAGREDAGERLGLHLDRYVTEFTGRHNVREADSIDQMTDVVSNMAGTRQAYATPIAKQSTSAAR